jgi:hypothetical protein
MTEGIAYIQSREFVQQQVALSLLECANWIRTDSKTNFGQILVVFQYSFVSVTIALGYRVADPRQPGGYSAPWTMASIASRNSLVSLAMSSVSSAPLAANF